MLHCSCLKVQTFQKAFSNSLAFILSTLQEKYGSSVPISLFDDLPNISIFTFSKYFSCFVPSAGKIPNHFCPVHAVCLLYTSVKFSDEIFFLNTQSSTRRICAWIPNEQARGDCAKSWHEDEFCRGTRDETEPDAR